MSKSELEKLRDHINATYSPDGEPIVSVELKEILRKIDELQGKGQA